MLDERDGREIGVWEITPGTASDFEVDEVFVVLAGRARVEFTAVAGRCRAPAHRHRAGLGRAAHRRACSTTWTVHETLRKVYLA